MTDNQHLYTNYHPFFEIVRDFLKIKSTDHMSPENRRKIRHSRLPVFIYNQSGDLIFNPVLNVATINNFSMMNIFAKEKDDLIAQYDFIEIVLSPGLKIIKPLERADVAEKDEIFLVGAPTEFISQKKEFGPQASARSNMYFSKGTYLPYDEAAQKLKIKPIKELNSDSAILAQKAVFFYGGRSLPGMSGGPYLNKSGKVVGIHRGERETEESKPISIGIKSQFVISFPFEIGK